jgi:hypothetical protein
MEKQNVIAWLREKYEDIAGELNERGRRRWAAVEARSLGWDICSISGYWNF